jgi:hypothetical protein
MEPQAGLVRDATVVAWAQDNDAVTSTLRGNTRVVFVQPAAQPGTNERSSYPPFCPPKTCLYYAGDFESSYYSADALFNSNYINGSLVGQAWVGVKPDRDVTVTGATFVEALQSDFMGINPTPFVVQVGIKPGQAGRTVCSTVGNATYSLYGNGGELVTYSYTIKKLAKSCKLKKGTVYYVNLLPTSDAGYGYLWNVPTNPGNHHGWKNDLNDCYFNGSGFNADYVTCNSQGPFSELDIGLTGKD